MENGQRRASKPLRPPQKFRPSAPGKRKNGALDDPLLLAPDVLDDVTRRELLQDMLRPRRASPSSLDRPSVSAGPSSGAGDAHSDKESFAHQLRSRVQTGSSHNSDDLVTAMAARLKTLEAQQKAYQSELHELHGQYRQLNDKFQRERQLREEAETAVLTLYDEKEMLEVQVMDLESRVGTPSAGAGGASAEAAGKTPPHQLLHLKQQPRRHTSEAGTDASSVSGSGAKESGAASSPLSLHTPRTSPRKGKEVFDLFSGDYNAGDGEKVAPTHFINTAMPGTALYSPQKGVASDNGGQAAGNAKARQAHAPRRHSAASVDVVLLQKNARILSDYVGWKGVVRLGNQAGIRERDIVRVVVYKNGICVNQGPFRPFGWALCDAFLDDLTEGYYPYEFKEKYPDGFPIEVTDRSEELCQVDQHGAVRTSAAAARSPSSAKAAKAVFPSEGGRRLGGKPLAAGQARPIHTLQEQADKAAHYTPVSAAEFLSKVPAQKVTASGQLISVRQEVAALMGVKGSSGGGGGDLPAGTIKHVTATEAAYRHAHAEQQQQSPAAEKHSMAVGHLVALLVRLPSGQKITFHMAPEDTVEALRSEFVTAAPEFKTKRYELYQAFPVKCEWGDHRSTLASLGVKKSCTLMVKVLK